VQHVGAQEPALAVDAEYAGRRALPFISARPSSMPLQVGDRAPEFELPDQEGRNTRLSDFVGKKNVILAFFVLANTPT
jgi:cytochrome oxidase Cu insertion factor (SCO1/SenC/PrrC family)